MAAKEQITQVIGAVVDVQFDGHLPADPERARDRQPRQPPRAGGCPAPRREHRAHHRDGRHRRPRPRPGGQGHRRSPIRCRWATRRWGGSSTWSASRWTKARPVGWCRRDPPDPPAGAGVRRAVDGAGDPRHRHQGRRPAGALRQGRQDRPLRRRGRRQDRADHGADQQHREGALGLLGVRRRRRADPRGQRSLSRDDRSPASSSRTT